MTNSVLFLVSIVFYLFAVIAAYKWFGRTGLYVFTAISAILANIQVCKNIDIFGLSTTAGNVLYAASFLVTDILLSDIVQIFQARMEIEPIALKLAGPRIPREELLKWKGWFLSEGVSVEKGYEIDMAMHLGIIGYCGNAYIIDMMKKVFDKNTRVIVSSTENREHMKEALKEHLEILDCLLEQDFEKAAVMMRTHVAGCRNAALDFFYSA